MLHVFHTLSHIWCYRLEDLFHAQGVDLIIQGHEHSYERLWPVYNFKVLAYNYHDPQAPVHIISGAAGCSEGGDPMGSKGIVFGFL